MKTCSRCKIMKALDEFYSAGPGRKQSYCKDCGRAYKRTEYTSDPEKFKAKMRAYNRANPQALRERHLKSKYGMTDAEYQKMLLAQGGVCLICRQFGTKALHIDHDHRTGAIRGLLCHHCNTGLGAFKDSPELLQAAAIYVTRES